MYFLLSILWFIRTAKVILFYFYLWQLKEYHLGRFLAHLKTEKGGRLIINKLILAKLLIFFPFLTILLIETGLKEEALLSVILGIILFLYLAELLFVFKNIFEKELKRPVLTKKTVFLIPTGLLIEILILSALIIGSKDIFFFTFWLLFLDILAPLISSLIVLLFQIPTVLIRNKFILKKAKEKIERQKGLKVIGITGSYGKTSTKEFLATILSSKFKVLKTKEHQNSEVGISQCILKELNPRHQVFVVEMGAYGRGGIKLLADIAKPQIGILTGINQQHLALFGSLKKIIRTKYELIENLSKDGLAVFNGDNEHCLELYKKTNIPKKIYRAQKSFIGVELKTDIWAEDIVVDEEYLSFKVCRKGESADFEVNVLGAHNILNILAATLVAQELGMSLKECSRAALKIKPGQGSMKLVKGKEDPFILDASYSANPDGVIGDLDYLKIWPNRRAVVMPCLIELGRASRKIHKRIGRKIGQVCNMAIITTRDYFKEIKEEAVGVGMKEKNILFIDDPKEIIEQINIFSSPGDVVLLEGRVSEKVIKSLSS